MILKKDNLHGQLHTTYTQLVFNLGNEIYASFGAEKYLKRDNPHGQ